MLDPKLSELIPRDKRAVFTETFLERYRNPAFGSMTKAEIDLLVFSLLHELGAIGPKSQYEVARLLRITPTRVRTLKMQMELRDTAQTDDNLRQRIIECLSQSRFAKDGSIIQFGIEDPLLREDIAWRLKKLGATADSSFNREVVKIQLDAFVDFIADLLPEDRRELVRKALIKAGMEDMSFKGVLLGALGKLGEKLAGPVGDAALKQASEVAGPYIKPFFTAAEGAIVGLWKKIF